MFERSSGVGGSGGGRHPRIARADRTVAIRHSEMRIEAMVLRDAADWAGQHGVDLDDPFATGPAGGVGKYVASDGTPWIDEHVAKEYGALRATSTWEATDLIIDALDLRHRFPRLWRAVRDLRVRVRYARKISKACRDLSREAAAAVDAELARTASYGLPWARLEKILAAAIINADPDLHKAKLAAAKFDRTVWLSPCEDGLRTLVIKADQGDQLLLYALIDRIAEILKAEGDTDPVDIRRAKASGWLARPEDLVVLLYRHAGGTPPARPDQQSRRGNQQTPTAAAGGAASEPDHGVYTNTDTDDAAGKAGTGDAESPAAADGDPGDPRDADEPGDETTPTEASSRRSETAGDDQSAPDVDRRAPRSHEHDGAHVDTDAAATDEPAEADAHETTDKTRAADAEAAEVDEAVVPQPPPDYPDYDWDAPEPPWNPGASDDLPPPRTRWHGTEHLPDPQPPPPTWCYEPDPGPPGPQLGTDVPRLVDYLTSAGLKPARPRVILNVSLTDQTLLTGEGVVRSDEMGPILLSQLLDLLRDHHCQISLRPVLDPANLAAVDAYEIPDAMRAAVRSRHPASVFPFSSRRGKHLELDHTVPHTRSTDGPKGQTRVGNLGPLAHPEHQAKTDGVWHVDQPHPGVFLWRSPHGHYFLVTNQGTQALGPMPTPRPVRLPERPTVVRLDDSRRRSRHSRRRA